MLYTEFFDLWICFSYIHVDFIGWLTEFILFFFSYQTQFHIFITFLGYFFCEPCSRLIMFYTENCVLVKNIMLFDSYNWLEL